MAGYALGRFLQLLALLLVISILTFVLMRGLLGDPIVLILGPDASVDQATIARMRHDMGFDQPLPVQYLNWLEQAVTGDFGRSLRTPISVHDALLSRLPVTLELSIEALVLALLLAIPLGIQAALRPGSRMDVSLS